MAATEDVIKALSALGIGTTVGAVVTAMINARASKGKSRAEAADLLIGAAERVGKLNAEQAVEIKDLKKNFDVLYLLVLDHVNDRISDEDFLVELKKFREAK